jgi:integration host factor subunit alpha
VKWRGKGRELFPKCRGKENQSGFSKHKSNDMVETVFELIKKTLKSGEEILIGGFGTFSVKKKAPRKGRNPPTGEDLTLDSRRLIVFKRSAVMRERVNPQQDPE